MIVTKEQLIVAGGDWTYVVSAIEGDDTGCEFMHLGPEKPDDYLLGYMRDQAIENLGKSLSIKMAEGVH